MVCGYQEQETLLSTIRTVIQEELRNGEFQPKSNTQAEQLAEDDMIPLKLTMEITKSTLGGFLCPNENTAQDGCWQGYESI
jgi:hypothetical protein